MEQIMARKFRLAPVAIGRLSHPTTGQVAPTGQQWVRSAMNGEYVLEAIGTPFTCSVSSEHYWAS